MTAPAEVDRAMVPSMPPVTLAVHEAALRAAFSKLWSEVAVPLSRDEVEALVRELGYTRAELGITRHICDGTHQVLDEFAKRGVKLERTVDDAWAAKTEQGWTHGANLWDALQKATRIESTATQLSRFADSLVNDRER